MYLVLIVLCLTLFCFYRFKVNRMNIQWVPLRSFDILDLSPSDLKALQNMKQSKLVISVICRDVPEYRIRLNMRILKDIGSMFEDYRIVLFENDSDMNTRQVLKQYCQDPRVKLLTCEKEGDTECRLKETKAIDDVNYSDHSKRVTKLARFRQKVFDHITNNLSTFNYMLVFDIDLIVGTNALGLVSCFKTNNWGSMAAYSISKKSLMPFSYDTFSICLPNRSSLKLNKRANWMTRFLFYITLHSNVLYSKILNKRLLRVKSAFNGMCFYHLPSVINSNCKYIDSKYNTMGECEHVTFARGLVKNNIPSYINLEWVSYVINDI